MMMMLMIIYIKAAPDKSTTITQNNILFISNSRHNIHTMAYFRSRRTLAGARQGSQNAEWHCSQYANQARQQFSIVF